MGTVIRQADARAIVRIVGECRDLGDEVGAWWAHLFSEAARHVGAALAAGGEAAFHTNGLSPLGTVGVGWENGFNQAVFAEVMASKPLNLLDNPQFAAYFHRPDRAPGTGLTRQDLVPDREWTRSFYFRSLHEPMGLGHTMISFVPLDASGVERSGITLARPAGERRDFGARDRTFVRELHLALAPLIGGPLARFSDPSPAALSRRSRQVLRCMLEGDGDKQTASRLGMSRYTVNDHTKAIFSHFGVSSRSELLARWISRGWGRKFIWAVEGAG